MRVFSSVLVISGMCLSLVSTAAAQTTVQVTTPTRQSLAEPNTVTITPFVSVSFGLSEDWKSSLGIGAAVGYDFTRNLGVEFEVGVVHGPLGDPLVGAEHPALMQQRVHQRGLPVIDVSNDRDIAPERVCHCRGGLQVSGHPYSLTLPSRNPEVQSLEGVSCV